MEDDNYNNDDDNDDDDDDPVMLVYRVLDIPLAGSRAITANDENSIKDDEG